MKSHTLFAVFGNMTLPFSIYGPINQDYMGGREALKRTMDVANI